MPIPGDAGEGRRWRDMGRKKPDQINLWRPCAKVPQVISRLLSWMVKLGPFRSPDCLSIVSFVDKIQEQT